MKLSKKVVIWSVFISVIYIALLRIPVQVLKYGTRRTEIYGLQSRIESLSLEGMCEYSRAPQTVHKAMGTIQSSLRRYLDQTVNVLTAEDVMNIHQFNSQADLNSDLDTTHQHLSREQVSRHGPITILSWTIKYMYPSGPWYPEADLAFRNCALEPWMHCQYTHDRNHINRSEAVLFHAQATFDMPKYRLSNQKWIFWEIESPQNTWLDSNLTKMRDIFNLTSTYTLDSTVPIPSTHTCHRTDTHDPRAKPRDYTSGKTGMAAWFAHECQSASRREKYVLDLQQYIVVDVFGFCGPASCEKHDKDTCLKEIIAPKYKFFLAFEDSLCSDYITANLWKIYALNLSIVPVVLGRAHYEDYFQPGTYIDVRTYDSPLSLAEYLVHLDNNPDEYNQLIANRGSLSCGVVTNYKSYMCQLCRHLHNERNHKEFADDVSEFWSQDRRCVSPQQFYPGIVGDSDVWLWD